MAEVPSLRLNEQTLGGLPAQVGRPGYDRRKLTTGILHLGVGAFHRAHQAHYTEQLLDRAPTPPWGITGVSLRSPATRDALGPQDGLYTLAVRHGDGETLRVVGALRQMLVASEDPQAVLALLAHPDTRIVGLTITEKGYCHDPATGRLRPDHPEILQDLTNPDQPRTAPGLIIEGLRRRRAKGMLPFTVMSCDNLPANGKMTAAILEDYAARREPGLGSWVADNLVCPNSMVDRIVPATTEADRRRVAAALGVLDAWPVVTEPFSQWVIENRFPSGRPAWEEAGAELVADVEPYERMKLRLLNGAHSLLAYLGFLAGHRLVADAIGDPDFARFILRFWDEEAAPSLSRPTDAAMASYTRALLARFANRALAHQLRQIAMDGTQKLPQRWLATIRDLRRIGAPFPRLALGVAAWMRYVAGTDESGRPIDVQDPMAIRLRQIAAEAGPNPVRLVPALLSLTSVFGEDLPADPIFARTIEQALEGLFRAGVRRILAEL
jgi:fructuronate reductase